MDTGKDTSSESTVLSGLMEELAKAQTRIAEFEKAERKLAELCARVEEYFSDGTLDANTRAKLMQQGDVLDTLEDWEVQQWLRNLRMQNKARFPRFPCRD